MFGWLFGRKKELEEIKGVMKDSFDKVRTDIDKVGE